jgi:hypothetical protein
MINIKENDLVYYYDDETKYPYLVHEVNGNLISLGQMEYPDIEQDYFIDISDVRLFTKDELIKAKKIINNLIN